MNQAVKHAMHYLRAVTLVGSLSVLMTALASTLLLGVASAQTQGFEEFEQARQAFEDEEFDVAVARFESLLGSDPPRLSSRPLILESHKYLGASYLQLGRSDEASAQFERLLELDPAYQMDPAVMSPAVMSLFESVQERVRLELERAEEARRAAEEERRRQELEREQRQQALILRLRSIAEEETVERRNSRLVATIPFGAGQFQNGQRSLGMALAVSQGLLTLGSVGTAVGRGLALDEARQGDQSASQFVRRMTISNWSLTGVLGALMIFGVIDAHLRFRETVRETRDRELPEDVRNDLELVVGPQGFELRF